jgi:hypothetical protein
MGQKVFDISLILRKIIKPLEEEIGGKGSTIFFNVIPLSRPNSLNVLELHKWHWRSRAHVRACDSQKRKRFFRKWPDLQKNNRIRQKVAHEQPMFWFSFSKG